MSDSIAAAPPPVQQQVVQAQFNEVMRQRDRLQVDLVNMAGAHAEAVAALRQCEEALRQANEALQTSSGVIKSYEARVAELTSGDEAADTSTGVIAAVDLKH